MSKYRLLLSLFWLAACSQELSVSDGVFYCVDDFECKPGYACNLTTNTCVLLNDLPEAGDVDASIELDLAMAELDLALADMDVAVTDADVALSDVLDAAIETADMADSCENGELDQDETGVDCGGDCGPCDAGLGCVEATDCSSLVCDAGVCQPIVCGDGVINGFEACDDGNEVNTDECTVTCQLARCGDGIVWAEVEQCDDANAIDTDECRNNCALARCGDGVRHEGVEACDDGNTIATDACTNLCERARCGDRLIREGFEECDDGNESNLDQCTTSCMMARCGDGVVYPESEQCDDGNADNSDGCLNNCERAQCGDGNIQSGVEQCDDGNQVSEVCPYEMGECTVCDASCRLVEGLARVCGDAVVDMEEACDDGNADESDACLSTCVVATCGDGWVHEGVETCDDANQVTERCQYGQLACEVCSDRCQTEAGQTSYCGDGLVALQEEECDEPEGDGFCEYGDVSCMLCSESCVLVSGTVRRCGDTILDPEESCDDGNTLDGDGCDSRCQSEALCGNGIVEAGEDCDLLHPSGELFCDEFCKSRTPELPRRFNFTSCGITGPLGPLQTDCDNQYGVDVVVVDAGFQHIIVPVSGTYRITTSGAQGGGTGGLGAMIAGDFELQQGDVIRVLVGQEGDTTGMVIGLSDGTGGGGGGSFVEVMNTSTLLIAAGGGGGGDRSAIGSDMDGRVSFRGGEESFAISPWNANTPGDTGNAATGSELTGFGGCGWFSRFNGEMVVDGPAIDDEYCDAIILGGRGGTGIVRFGTVSGGFGGGGIGDQDSGDVHGGGGGGGYSGGAGGGRGTTGSPGGGGGSFNNGVNKENLPGMSVGDGRVRFELLDPL